MTTRRTPGPRRLTAAPLRFAALLSLAAALMMLALPAQADVVKKYVQPNDVTYSAGHACLASARDSLGNRAVHCADFYWTGHPDGIYYDAFAQNQVFCQNSQDQVVQCAGIHETIGVYGSGGTIPRPSSGVCGRRFGHSACPSGRVVNRSGSVRSATVPNEYWGSSTNVSVVLPGSGRTVTLPNKATIDHYRLITKNSV